MNDKYLISRDDFAKRFGTQPQSLPEKTQAWLDLAQEIFSNWDGISATAFIDPRTPGQFAILCLTKLHRAVNRKYDLFSFIGYSMDIANRVPRAFRIVGADEYLAVWDAVAALFPGGKLPTNGDELRIVMERLPRAALGKIEQAGRVLATGEGMKRPFHEYVWEYVTAHPEEFSEADQG